MEEILNFGTQISLKKVKENNKYRVRWAFSISNWFPSEEEWDSCLNLLEPEEMKRICSFKRPTKEGLIIGRFNPDAKASLIGRLLQRKLVHSVLDIPYNEMKFARTKENKPYLQNKPSFCPNFNYNVSHHGDWVVLASDAEWLVGIDVMDMKIPRAESDEGKREFFETMRNCFTPAEWKVIKLQPSNLVFQENQFFRHWALKESYIKAVGIGLGFELQRAQFTLNNPISPSAATIEIDSVYQANWKFFLDYLSLNSSDPNSFHVVATAYGPFEDAILSYRETLQTPNKFQTKPFDPSLLVPIKTITFSALMS